MTENWITIYSTDRKFHSEMVKQVLADNDIESVILNQQDSSYGFGNIEVCVRQDDVIRAKHIINSVKF